VGALAESYSIGGCGELMKASISDQYMRMRDGDPSFYQNPLVLNEIDSEELKAISLGRLIMHNTDIEDIPENLFFIPPKILASDDEAVFRFNQDLTVSRMILAENQTMKFTITSYYTGWFGFGFGETMNDLKGIFLFRENNGEWQVDTAYSTYRARITIIPVKESIILDLEDITPNGQQVPKIFQFSRYLSSEPVIDDNVIPISFAGTNSSWPGYHSSRYVDNSEIEIEVQSG
jgi:hypothetical protein